MSITSPAESGAALLEGDVAAAASANALLRALRHVVPGWTPRHEVLRLRAGHTISENGMAVRAVYFPVDCVISKLTVMDDGRAIEFATVGREGVAGATQVLTGVAMPMRVICQVPGLACRVDADELREVVRGNDAALQLLQRYLQSLLVQVAQIAACNRVHPVEERCARWLLMTHDRVSGDEFLLTQEFLAQMLGVRRARVNVAAGILQKAGLIRYTRGRIRISDRERLERSACECYRVIRAEYDRLATTTARTR
jgi:CRP-like cAMP-binding protein